MGALTRLWSPHFYHIIMTRAENYEIYIATTLIRLSTTIPSLFCKNVSTKMKNLLSFHLMLEIDIIDSSLRVIVAEVLNENNINKTVVRKSFQNISNIRFTVLGNRFKQIC